MKRGKTWCCWQDTFQVKIRLRLSNRLPLQVDGYTPALNLRPKKWQSRSSLWVSCQSHSKMISWDQYVVERKLFSMETGSWELTCFYGNHSSSYPTAVGEKKGQKVTNENWNKTKQKKILVYLISVMVLGVQSEWAWTCCPFLFPPESLAITVLQTSTF